jgi:mannose-1-phosphate guanylyltransferase
LDLTRVQSWLNQKQKTLPLQSLPLTFLHVQAVLLVAPSDHLIPDKADFHRAISARLPQVRNYVSDFIGALPCEPIT